MNTTGNFQKLSSHDIFYPAVLNLDQQCFPRPWTEKNWQGISDGFHQLYAWTNKEDLLAFSLYHYLPGDETAHLLKICLRPEVRGTKVTRDFWLAQVQHLAGEGIKFIYLEVEIQNTRAQAFYQKVGFKTLRQIPKYYSDGQDAIVMQLTL